MDPYLSKLAQTQQAVVPQYPSSHLLDAHEDDRARHLRSIGQIAAEVRRPVDEVQPLYEDILATLEQNAEIRDFIPIFVSRRIKQLLVHS